MANPFVAEIRVFPFNFPPKGWAFCDGQLLSISQNTALFSLLGTTFGGDGKSNFALPNMQGNISNMWGQGPGLSLYDLGQASGSETVTVLTSEMPTHNHLVQWDSNHLPSVGSPANAGLGSSGVTAMYGTPAANLQPMSPSAIPIAGGSLPHNNMMPYLTLNWCIALQGVYPPRT